MKTFDIFRKLRDDVETSTWIGGLYSVLAFIIGGLLILFEFSDYAQIKWIKEFKIENDDVHSKMDIAISLTMTRVPCYLLSIELEDDLGHKTKPDILNFTRIDVFGEPLAIQQYPNEFNADYRGSDAEKNDVSASVDRKEACDISLSSRVDKVPGNIHINFEAHKDRFLQIALEKPPEHINLNYRLKNIHFGPENPISKHLSNFNGEPLNYKPYLGLEPGDNSTLRSFTSYFKVVPTTFMKKESFTTIETMQFSQSFKDMVVSPQQNPAVTFKYDVSPITMIFRIQESDFYFFIVQLCAVVGGIFALMGLMNSVTWESMVYLKKILSQSVNS